MMLAKMILFTNEPAHTLNNIELQKDRISFLSVYFSAVGKQLKTFYHQQRPITGTHDTCFFCNLPSHTHPHCTKAFSVHVILLMDSYRRN